MQVFHRNFLNNRIPPNTKKIFDKFDLFIFCLLLVLSWFLFSPTLSYKRLYIWLIVIIPIEVGIIWAHFDRYRVHPVGVAYTEEGIYLKRRSGKIKFIPWDKIERFGFSRRGDYAVIPIGLTGIFLYDEAKDNLLYYVEKYGVKKNLKLAEYLQRERMRNLLEW